MESLSQAGLNPTAQRIAVFQYIHNDSDHPTPEQVKDAVDRVFPTISLATIYNTLNALVAHGLVHQVKIPHSGRVVYDANTSKHYHFIDEAEGKLIDLNQESITVDMNLPEHFDIQDVDIFVKGKLKG